MKCSACKNRAEVSNSLLSSHGWAPLLHLLMVSYFHKGFQLRFNFKEPSNNPNEPAEGLQLEYVNGYRSEDARNNLFFTKKPNEVVFMAGAIGVLFDVKKNTQSFLGAGEKKSANGHTDDIVSLAVTRDRTLLATGQVGEKPLVCIWDLASGALKNKFSLGRGMRACKSLVWSSDNKRVIACALDNDHTIFGLNPESGATLWLDKVKILIF